MSTVPQINEREFEAEVHRAAIPVVVDFFASWCPPCRVLAPMLDQMAMQFEGQVKFVKVNIDDAPELAARFQVTSIPTLVFLRDGQELNRSVGVPAAGSLAQAIEDLSSSAAA